MFLTFRTFSEWQREILEWHLYLLFTFHLLFISYLHNTHTHSHKVFSRTVRFCCCYRYYSTCAVTFRASYPKAKQIKAGTLSSFGWMRFIRFYFVAFVVVLEVETIYLEKYKWKNVWGTNEIKYLDNRRHVLFLLLIADSLLLHISVLHRWKANSKKICLYSQAECVFSRLHTLQFQRYYIYFILHVRNFQ